LLGSAQERNGALPNLVEPWELHGAISQLTSDPKRESITQADPKTVRPLLTNWLVGLPEDGLIWGEPRATPERSRANRVFVELVILLLSPPCSGVPHERSGAHREHTRSSVFGFGTLGEDYEPVSAPEIFGLP
jgi:hypothetical protein